MSTAAQTSQTDIDAVFEQGRMYHQTGRLAEAQAAYDSVLARDPNHFDALQLLGVIAFQSGDAARAVDLISKAISLFPDDAAFYCNLGNAQQALGRLDEALASYTKAVEMDASYAGAHFSRGTVQLRMANAADAVKSFDAAITVFPDFTQAYLSRGNALQQLEKHHLAILDYDRVLALQPDLYEAHVNRGMARMALNDFIAAVANYDRAIGLDPQRAEAHQNRGVALVELDRLEAAVASFETAIRLQPSTHDAYINLSNAYRALKRLPDALGALDRLVAQTDVLFAAHFHRGNLQYELEFWADAIASFDKALALNPTSAETHHNRGLALSSLGRDQEAYEAYNRAIAITPDYADAYSNRGLIEHERLQLDAALASYDKAIAFDPGSVQAQWNKSLTLLLRGEYAEGWKLFEKRFEPPVQKAARTFIEPKWNGIEPLAGKRVLVHSEQGLGDTLQFCRYIKLVADLGAYVILEVERPLVAVLRQVAGVSEVVRRGDALPAFDYQIATMSLPFAFKTELATIPAQIPYIQAEPEKAAYWREKLGPKTKPRVGLVWNGGMRKDSALRAVNERRNIALDLIATLNTPDIEFYSLQKGEPAEGEFRERGSKVWPTPNLHNFVSELNDFSDTAGLIENLDLVISVDTSTAHLAAAMGKPVWILNRFDTCWRWLQDRPDSVWYPTVRLYRQKAPGDWGSVLAHIKGDLQKL